MRTPAEQFHAAIRGSGLEPPEVIEADGRLHRFPSNGKRGDDAGWYVLYNDGIPAGAFGCWRTGTSQTWRAEADRRFTPQEEAEHRARIEAIRKVREAEEAQRRSEARDRAAAIWKSSQSVQEHPYLEKKGVKAYGLRVDEGALVVPMRDATGVLHSLQFIFPDGEKKFLTGGRVAGCYYSIGKPNGVLYVAEGYATAASVHEATGHAVAVAFNAGNLEATAKALRAKFPSARIVIAGDNDESGAGQQKAEETARAVGGGVAIPSDSGKDWNDVYRELGAAAVASAIENAPEVGHSLSSIAYRRMIDIEAKPVRWLWPDRLARGKVSLIAGHPGLGKSQITTSIAAIVSSGGRWPVDRTECKIGSVLILSAEDDPEDTIRPRLEAAGADLSKIYILDAVREETNSGETKRRAFNLATDLMRLGGLLADLRDVSVLIIDPISAYLGGTDSHKNADVRALLAPVSELAAKHGVAVVCVSHLNKGGSDALTRVTGSLAFVAAARAVYVVAKDEADPRRRLFLPLKNNLGNDETGLAFSVESHLLPSGIETSRVSWEGEAVTVTADEALCANVDRDERGALEEAKDFLMGLLSDGPVPARQIRKDADDAGHAWATIRRAQKVLGIEAIKEGMKAGWMWGLPTKVLKSSEDAQPKTVSAFGKNEHLRQAGAVEVRI